MSRIGRGYKNASIVAENRVVFNIKGEQVPPNRRNGTTFKYLASSESADEKMVSRAAFALSRFGALGMNLRVACQP